MSVTNKKPKTTYLKDYTPPDFLIDSAFLHFDLGEKATTVETVLSVKRNPATKTKQRTLVLNGEGLQLKSVLLDGKPLPKSRYRVDKETLQILRVPEHFTLETKVVIKPQQNT